MDYANSPFHKFMGWKTLALTAVAMAYTLWFTGPGPYGQLTGLAPHIPLEGSGFYTGTQAVEALGALDADGRRIKFLSLLCDIPFMILWALVFEAFIAFGIRRLNLTAAKWQLLFVLPLAFLLADFAEDSFIALTLVTGSEVLGTIAGFLTALKFFFYIPANLAALGMGASGLVYWIIKGRKAA